MDLSGIWGAIGCFAVAGVLYFFARLSTATYRTFGARAVKVAGTIVRVNADLATRTYYPVVGYRDKQGVEHEIQGTTSSSGLEEGLPREVLYDPERPASAVLASDLQTARVLTGVALATCGLGIVGIVGTIVIAIRGT